MREKISDVQGINLVTLFILGSSLIFGTSNVAKQDSWICIILAIIFGILMSMIYSNILICFPGKNLFDIVEIIFGKIIGKVINFLFVSFAFVLSILVFRDYGDFATTASIPETPNIVPIIFMSAVVILICKKDLNVIANSCNMFLAVDIVLFIIMTTLLIPQMKIDNIKPIMNEGIDKIIKGAFFTFAFPIGETVILSMVLSRFKYKKSPAKIYRLGILIGGAVLLIAKIRNTLVIGDNVSRYYFPNYMTISRIHIGTFLQRQEIYTTILITFSTFIKSSICVLAVCKGLAKIFEIKEYRYIVTPVTILIITLTQVAFKSILEVMDFTDRVWPWYSFVFEVILPLIILLVAKIKLKASKNSSNIQI